VLFIMSVASIAVYGIIMAGWSSNNKYAMMGGLLGRPDDSLWLTLGLAFVIVIRAVLRMIDLVGPSAPCGSCWCSRWVRLSS
jgi:NADH-quinone oxidoreductase subunit H